jgi:hypothetical protein
MSDTVTMTTITAHEAAKRFTASDLRAARHHYGQVISEHATEEQVSQALIARALVSASSREGKRAYYASLYASADEATRALAEAAFTGSLAESDARRERAATPAEPATQHQPGHESEDPEEDAL